MTTTHPRTTADLHRMATMHSEHHGPNAAWHRGQYIARVIETAESEAYAEVERRGIRARYIGALYAERARTNDELRTAVTAWNKARRLAGLRMDWTPAFTDNSDAAKAHRFMVYATGRAEAAANTLARATSTTTTVERILIGMAEAGDVIGPEHLMATVPDEFGRVSPFAVFAYNPASCREYNSRNLDLATAVREQQAAVGRGHRATVGFDTCG